MGLLSGSNYKKTEKEELARLIAEFLEKGGVVQQIPMGVRKTRVRLSRYDVYHIDSNEAEHSKLYDDLGDGTYRRKNLKNGTD